MIGPHLQLFANLHSHRVEYLLIGGTLAIAYGVPRVTKDIDIFLNPVIDNAAACLQALMKSGLGTAALTTAEQLCQTEVTIFNDCVRLDVLTKVKGLDFAPCWTHRVHLQLGNVLIPALNVDYLIQSKHAAGRPHDLTDIALLEKARQLKKT